MRALQCALVLLGVVCAVDAGRSKKLKWVPSFIKIVTCPTKNHATIANSSFHLSANGEEFADLDFHFTRPAKSWSKMMIVINKCSEVSVINSCEYVNTWSWSLALCQILAAKNMPWSPTLQSIIPPLRCPVATGPYKLRNATFDLELGMRMGLPLDKGNSAGVLIVETQHYDERGRLHMCMLLEMKPKRIRV